ncbi:hypothetical protein CHELA1G11_12916 [Hyphomicrobiales bacterium]|nr:hypothetical protein CHELA1G2_11393 [Hyphomicrobiales bacterium]CAH1668019.1 hypothetical protein CHELA1G11_12916 [Hyphomicrobiales bacterium]
MRRGWKPRRSSPGPNALKSGNELFETIGDPALGQIIGRHLNENAIARQDADAVLAHLAGGMRHDLMVVLEFDAKHRIGEQFRHNSRELEELFFRHSIPCGHFWSQWDGADPTRYATYCEPGMLSAEV